MFLRRLFGLGAWKASDSKTRVALDILVLPPPYLGRPVLLNTTGVNGTKLKLEDAQGGDHEHAKSGAVMQCTAGWDFIPSTQDRNVGIFNTVEVEWIVGVVRIKDAYVNILNVSDAGGEASAALPLGDDRHVSAWLELSVSAEVLGYGDEVIKGTFSYWITPSTNTSKILLRDIVKDVVFQSSAQEVPLGIVLLRDVKLWWPHTHSERQFQPLYRLYVQFRSEDGVAVHQTQAEFGVRTVSSYVHPRTKSFALKVNGHPIFLVGGNWVTTDQFLRFAGSKTRYLHELLLLRNAGFNCVRVWGGGISETDHFFESADSLGLLVYQEFWLTGDNNGRWAGRYDWPEDHGAMLENARDVIVRLRNHPSLAWYGGGNELYPLPSDDNRSEVSPPFTIEKELRSFLRCLDGSRPYITSSVTEIGDLFDSDRSLAPKDGPYGVLPVRSFYDRNPGLSSPLLTDEEKERSFLPHVKNPDAPGRNIGFQAEVGSVSHPEFDSLAKYLSEDALQAYPNCGEKNVHGGSVNEEWSFYKYLPFTDQTGIDHICQLLYPPLVSANSTSSRMDNIQDYTEAAQVAQFLQYKALAEGYSYRMWDWYSAVFLWKASSPSPTFRGALYDTFLETNGGYWGWRDGFGRGSHVRILLNQRDWTIHVINDLPIEVNIVSCEWRAYSLQGEELGGEISNKSFVVGDSVHHIKHVTPSWVGGARASPLAQSYGVQDVLLYKLQLVFDPHRRVGMETYTNSYFLTDPTREDSQSRLSLLGVLRKYYTVNVGASCHLQSKDSIECGVKNSSPHAVAIMSKLSLFYSQAIGLGISREIQVLPTYFTSNYITLLPGESHKVALTAPHSANVAFICSQQGQASIEGKGDLSIKIDGWNVKTNLRPILCMSKQTSLNTE